MWYVVEYARCADVRGRCISYFTFRATPKDEGREKAHLLYRIRALLACFSALPRSVLCMNLVVYLRSWAQGSPPTLQGPPGKAIHAQSLPRCRVLDGFLSWATASQPARSPPITPRPGSRGRPASYAKAPSLESSCFFLASCKGLAWPARQCQGHF